MGKKTSEDPDSTSRFECNVCVSDLLFSLSQLNFCLRPNPFGRLRILELRSKPVEDSLDLVEPWRFFREPVLLTLPDRARLVALLFNGCSGSEKITIFNFFFCISVVYFCGNGNGSDTGKWRIDMLRTENMEAESVT